MKAARFLLAALLLPGVVSAQGIVTLNTSADGLGECLLTSQGQVALVNLYVIHWPDVTAQAVSYRIDPCNSRFTWLAETSSFANVVGDSRTGIAVDYGACLSGPVLVQTISYFDDGTTPTDASMKVVASPNASSGKVEAVDCSGNVIFPYAGGVCINTVSSGCLCAMLGPPYANIPCVGVAAESTTWGHVKALYR